MIRIQSRANLDEAVALDAVREHYGLDGTLSPLPGERDRNFLLEGEGGVRYVVKVSSPDEAHEILEFENRMIERLAGETNGLVPGLVAARSGQTLIEHVDPSGATHRIRIIEFLPGTLLANVSPRSEALMVDIGRRMAELDSALGAVPEHPPARIDFDWGAGTRRQRHGARPRSARGGAEDPDRANPRCVPGQGTPSSSASALR